MKRRLLLPLWYRLFLSWGVIVVAYVAVPASFRLPAGWSEVALAGCAVFVVAGLAVTMRLGVVIRPGTIRMMFRTFRIEPADDDRQPGTVAVRALEKPFKWQNRYQSVCIVQFHTHRLSEVAVFGRPTWSADPYGSLEWWIADLAEFLEGHGYDLVCEPPLGAALSPLRV